MSVAAPGAGSFQVYSAPCRIFILNFQCLYFLQLCRVRLAFYFRCLFADVGVFITFMLFCNCVCEAVHILYNALRVEEGVEILLFCVITAA